MDSQIISFVMLFLTTFELNLACVSRREVILNLCKKIEKTVQEKKKKVCDHILIVKRPGQEYHQAVPRIRVINVLYQTTFHKWARSAAFFSEKRGRIQTISVNV